MRKTITRTAKRTVVVLSAVCAIALLASCGTKGEQSTMNGHNHHAMNMGNEHVHATGHSGHGGYAGSEPQAQAAFAFESGAARANEETVIRIRITGADGTPVGKFEETHEKLLHFIAVDEGLTTFAHLHPKYEGKGVFTVAYRFPAGGKFKLFADFTPSGGGNQVSGAWVTVEGTKSPREELKPDDRTVKTVGGTTVELSIGGAEAGKEAVLAYKLKDAASGKDVVDLEPYMGAAGHVVILSQDGERYLHVHPEDEKAKGPEARFMTSFPASGLYKAWAQFQRHGQVVTVPYTIRVN
ncbi:hypothetical protein [Cohnella zeiphila]|uniref:Secreted protein n=1 Tax=Cohnella zeiphila TaxID=2761120 RepID=A0A7X0SPA5_9BACL|nr:hypothetical protein [Cohnella zeiphila]MBB6733678.1 hypothetical protein [Cohnella zeiphila]